MYPAGDDGRNSVNRRGQLNGARKFAAVRAFIDKVRRQKRSSGNQLQLRANYKLVDAQEGRLRVDAVEKVFWG